MASQLIGLESFRDCSSFTFDESRTDHGSSTSLLVNNRFQMIFSSTFIKNLVISTQFIQELDSEVSISQYFPYCLGESPSESQHQCRDYTTNHPNKK